MNTARGDLTERLADAAMEERLARDARQLLAPFDHHGLAKRLGAEVRRRRRRRTSICAAAVVIVAGGIVFWSINDRAPIRGANVVAQQQTAPEAVNAPKPPRIVHAPVTMHDSPREDLELTTIPKSPAAEHSPGQPESGMNLQTGSSLVGIPFVIEPVAGSGQQPILGIYVPGGVQPLDTVDLSPAEQRAVYRVLGIQDVSTDSDTF